MPRHTFQYSKFDLPASPPYPNGQTVYRPLMIAKLTGSTGQQFTCLVWPDSGADACVFPLSFATAMGLDVLQMPQNQTGGVGNTGNTTHYADLTIEIMTATQDNAGNWTFNTLFSFIAYAGFTPGLEAQGWGLLGQVGFFERFQVTFDHTGRAFHVDVP